MREDVSRALQEFKIKTFGNKKTLEKSESLLSDDETVLFVTPTNISTIILSTQQQLLTLPGVVYLTDKRFIFMRNTKTPNNDFLPLEKVTHIDFKADGLQPGAIIVGDDAKMFSFIVSYKFDAVAKVLETFNSACDKILKEITTDPEIENNSSEPEPLILDPDYSITSAADEIRKYKSLLNDGIITQEEFEAKKKQLLNL